MVADDVFKDFTWYGGEGYRSVIFRLVTVAFLEHAGNVRF